MSGEGRQLDSAHAKHKIRSRWAGQTPLPYPLMVSLLNHRFILRQAQDERER